MSLKKHHTLVELYLYISLGQNIELFMALILFLSEKYLRLIKSHLKA